MDHPQSIASSSHERYRQLLAHVDGLPPAATAVAHPCSAAAIGAVAEAATLGLIVPILIGPEAKIFAAAREAGVDVSGFKVVSAPHSHAAAEQAVALVRAGEAQKRIRRLLPMDCSKLSRIKFDRK
jgi:phosphate butyryltransferase